MQKIKDKNIDVWKIVSISVLVLYGLFLLYPLFKLFYQAVLVDGKFSLGNFYALFYQKYYVKSIRN